MRGTKFTGEFIGFVRSTKCFTFPCISCYAFSRSVMSEPHVTGTVSVCSHLRCLWPDLVPVGSPASAVARWPWRWVSP